MTSLHLVSLDDMQARLTTLAEAQLLSDEELFALQDLVGDHLVVKPVGVPLTADMLHVQPAAARLQSLIALSEGFSTNDEAFARQVGELKPHFAFVVCIDSTVPTINESGVLCCGRRHSADLWSSNADVNCAQHSPHRTEAQPSNSFVF
eukprot:SAG11_NODE_1021_length_6157_cov_1.321063_3_plen_149_part_00